MSNEKYALWAEGVGKSFGATEVLKSASLWAEPGKVTTLMGRNGSGKTTLMKIAAGVLRPSYGVVSFLGDVRERHSLSRLARLGLMYVPQEGLVSPNYRVRDHSLAMESVFGALGSEAAIADARLADLMEQQAYSLSGGERLRVSMGLALARAPVVLVVDEPLVGLSPMDQEMIGQALRRLASRGTAVVTSGHDTRALLHISDVILWSVAGTTHHISSPEEALTHDQFRREYLGPGFA